MRKRPAEIVWLRCRSDAERRRGRRIACGVWRGRHASWNGLETGVHPGHRLRSLADSGLAKPTPHYGKFELTGLIECGAANWLTFLLSRQLQHVDNAFSTDAQRTSATPNSAVIINQK